MDLTTQRYLNESASQCNFSFLSFVFFICLQPNSTTPPKKQIMYLFFSLSFFINYLHILLFLSCPFFFFLLSSSLHVANCVAAPPHACVSPFSADKAAIGSCVFTYVTHLRLGCTVWSSLPLTRLLRFILRTPLYPSFCSSLALRPPSSVCVTSRTIPILSFFTVAHRLCASITVCGPSSVSNALLSSFWRIKICVCFFVHWKSFTPLFFGQAKEII